MIQQYYRDLNLPNGAGIAEIKAAYRRLAMKYHPDRGYSGDKFQQINEAYSQLMRFVNNKTLPKRINTTVSVSLEQVAARSPSTLVIAPDGVPKFINFEISPRWDNGQVVEISDPNFTNTIISVTYSIQKHPVFVKSGLDLYCSVEVSVWDIIVGGTISVPKLDGSLVKVKIAQNHTLAPVLTLTAQGLESESQIGDLIVTLVPVLPKTISPSLIDAILTEQHSFL